MLQELLFSSLTVFSDALLLGTAQKCVSFRVYLSFQFTLKGMNSSAEVIQFSSFLDKTQTCFNA